MRFLMTVWMSSKSELEAERRRSRSQCFSSLHSLTQYVIVEDKMSEFKHVFVYVHEDDVILEPVGVDAF